MNMAMSIITCGELDVTVWLHTAEDPDQALWTEATKRVAELKQKRRGDVSKIRTLAVSDGGAPNSVQRGQLYSDVLGGNTLSAVVTTVLSNRFKRGIATAISWLNPSFRAFQPEEFEHALEHLGLKGHVSTLLAELRRLQKQLPPVKTFEMLETQHSKS